MSTFTVSTQKTVLLALMCAPLCKFLSDVHVCFLDTFYNLEFRAQGSLEFVRIFNLHNK